MNFLNITRWAAVLMAFAGQASASEVLQLHARTRTPTSPGSQRFHQVESLIEWPADKTAIVVCDMWDEHWCRGCTKRVAEMAPRMNSVLEAARAKGVFIIHCPSDCMDYYADWPQRKLAQAAPPAKLTAPLANWRPRDPTREGPLPVDDSDSGCDCQPHCKQGAPWTRQIDALRIAPEDAITDNHEALNLMRQRGITNVIVLGVHLNRCVLGRPFSLRQLVTQGQQVVLMRDMTDAMYNPERAPEVSHFSGTDLVVDHVERYWCATVTSDDFVGQGEFRFADDKRPHLAMVMAEDEYRTEQTLPKFAADRLQKDFRNSLIFGSETQPNDLPGLEAVRTADVLVVSVRRRTLPAEQMAILRDHVAQGKAVVGIRTASHAFVPLRGEPLAEGQQQWPEFDRDVLGGNYTGHHESPADSGRPTLVQIISAMREHPVLAGIPDEDIELQSSLYKVSPLATTAVPLAMGRIDGSDQPPEPVAWTHAAGKSRVFYTSLGAAEDFELPEFVQLLENGIRWAAEKSPREAAAAGAVPQAAGASAR